MKLTTFSYTGDGGWTSADFPRVDSPNSMVIVFGASSFSRAPEPIHNLARAFPQSHVVGCSTAGEIHGTAIDDESLSVAVAEFEHGQLRSASARVSGPDSSCDAGARIAQQLAGDDLRAVFVLSPGHGVNGSELVRGLNGELPSSVVVTGGLAGDGDRFEKTWVLSNSGLSESEVCAIGLYGKRVHVGHGSKGGWDIFGPERRVTRSAGNVLYELDGRPALNLYKEYLGERASELPAAALLFPLALRTDESSEKQIVRTVLSIDEEEQSMTFAGDLPEGSLAQLMRANFDRLVDGASEAALMTKNGSGEIEATTGPMLSIAISCVGRRLVLGPRVEEELEATLDVLPTSAEQIGFYSYGEISPYASGSCDLHNQTMTLTTLCEV